MAERNLCRKINEEISIVDYASRLGFSLKKIGNYYNTEEHDSLIINPRTNQWIQASRDTINPGTPWKTVIDFSLRFAPGVNTVSEAIKELRDLTSDANIKPAFIKTTAEKQAEKKELVLPPKDVSNKNVFAYLTKTRGIEPSVVNSWIDRGNLYQGVASKEQISKNEKMKNIKNCVFVGKRKDGKPNFAQLRAPNQYSNFKGDCPGCDYSQGLYINNGSDIQIVCEAPIDVMSVQSLYLQEGKNIDEYNWLSLSGTGKWEAAVNQAEQNKIKKTVLALDADEAGILAAEQIINALKDTCDAVLYLPEDAKDWNEQLAFNKTKVITAEKQKGKETQIKNQPNLELGK